MNRTWRGDADGGLAAASGKEWAAGYSDARELGQDIEAILGGVVDRSHSPAERCYRHVARLE